MKKFLIYISVLLSIISCSEDKEILELNAKPSLVYYQSYEATISQGQSWTSGEPVLVGDDSFTFLITDVTYDDLVYAEHEFTIDENGVISLAEGNTMGIGNYVASVEVSNDYGSIENTSAIQLQIVDDVTPQIIINTPDGNNTVELLVNPAGEPVDEEGNILDGILDGVTLEFDNILIGEILMTPSDLFLLDRESNQIEGGQSDVGVIEMVGPFEPGTLTLSFNGTVTTVDEATLTVNITKLNLPYDEDLFDFDLSEEITGARNDVTEDLIGGLQTHLIYGGLKPSRAFWNVQADKNHPVDEFDTTPILRWLPFNAILGFDTETANKSQSVAIMQSPVDVTNAVQMRLNVALLSNKAADLTADLLRCDIRVATEEQYQAMLSASTQEEKTQAVNAWSLIQTTTGLEATAGANDATGYGYFNMDLSVDKVDLPVSESGQLRFLLHMVADKDGANPGYIAIQNFHVEGTFQDQD